MKSIIAFFSKEHMFSNLISILILLFGSYAIIKIKKDVFPDIDFYVTSINSSLPGASSEQIEKLIINNIEPKLKEVEGIKKVRSSSAEGSGGIIVELDPDARDTTKTNRDIVRVVEQQSNELPIEATTPVVFSAETSSIPIIRVNISGALSHQELRKTTKHIEEELSNINEVAQLSKRGYKDTEYIVEADPKALYQRGFSLADLIQILRTRNISLPAGKADSPSNIESIVRTEAQYATIKEIEDTVLFSNEENYETRIKDVAKVYEKYERKEVAYRVNGKEAIILSVSKKRNADALTLVQKVKSKLKKMETQLNENINIVFSADRSIYLANRLSTLSWNLIFGLILVIIILTIFLPWQVTLVVSAGIPIALFTTLIILYLAGLSMNLISLLGLIIVLGMLVDDAIVVSENIWRHIEKGGDKTAAIVDGTYEVFFPILASIATTISAFTPLMFMTGIFGSFFFEIPLVIITALLVSLFEAFLIMPAHFSSWAVPTLTKTNTKTNTKIRKPKFGERVFASITKAYVKYVQWSLGLRYWILTFSVFLIIAVGFMQFKFGRIVLFPSSNVNTIIINAETPVGTSIKETSRAAKILEQKVSLLSKKEIRDFTLNIGETFAGDNVLKRGSHIIQMELSLQTLSNKTRSFKQIIADLKQKIGNPPEFGRITIRAQKQGPPQGDPISINIKGDDFKILKEISLQIETELSKITGIENITNSFVDAQKEWKIIPRPKDTKAAQLTASDISQTVRAYFSGIVASSIKLLDEEIDIRVKFSNQSSTPEEQIKKIIVSNKFGGYAPLPSVADIKSVNSLNVINHTDYKRVITISAFIDIKKSTSAKANSAIKPFIKDLLKKYPSYSANFEGEDKDTKESIQSLGISFAFAILIIFSLLILTFKNILQPILILTSIPMGLAGVIITLLAHNEPMGFMSGIGAVALSGVIVNNGIVFIDFVNKARQKGVQLQNSIIEAAQTRLRPIMLTTITTVSGLAPTAYGSFFKDIFGIGGNDPFVVPIALALGWGLAFGSLMTVLFFPSFICIVDDIRAVGFKLKRSVFGERQ